MTFDDVDESGTSLAEPSPGLEIDDRPKGPTPGQVVAGLLLIAFGLAWLLRALDVDIPWRVMLATALILVGIVLVAMSDRPRTGGLVGIGVVLIVLLALAATTDALVGAPLSGGIGDRDEQPLTAAEIDSPYRLAIGDMKIDLGDLDVAGATTIEASVGLGQLTVVLPEGVAARVHARAAIGDVRLFGASHGGLGVDETSTDPGFAAETPRLELELSVGIGQVDVRR